MAKDRITIFLPAINEEVIYGDNSWESVNRKGNWALHDANKQGKKHKRRIPKYTYGSMSGKAGLLDVEYLKYNIDMGDLLISLSVSELYFLNNSVPKSNIDLDDIQERILTELRNVIDTSCIPPWDFWVISRDETNVDIIDSQENIIRRMDVLSKSYSPYKKVDNEYKKAGSVYFRGRAGKKSCSQFIAYDKVKEQRDRKSIDLRKILGLNPQQGCLRLESKTSKNPLKLNIDFIRQLSETNRDDTGANFDVVMSIEYQVNVMMKNISKLNLDKTITTRGKLLQELKKSGKLTKRQYSTALKVINHDNEEKLSTKLSQRTIKKYRKIITSLGFHYLYSDVELKPITREKVIEAISSDKKQIWL